MKQLSAIISAFENLDTTSLRQHLPSIAVFSSVRTYTFIEKMEELFAEMKERHTISSLSSYQITKKSFRKDQQGYLFVNTLNECMLALKFTLADNQVVDIENIPDYNFSEYRFVDSLKTEILEYNEFTFMFYEEEKIHFQPAEIIEEQKACERAVEELLQMSKCVQLNIESFQKWMIQHEHLSNDYASIKMHKIFKYRIEISEYVEHLQFLLDLSRHNSTCRTLKNMFEMMDPLSDDDMELWLTCAQKTFPQLCSFKSFYPEVVLVNGLLNYAGLVLTLENIEEIFWVIDTYAEILERNMLMQHIRDQLS